MVGFSGHRVVSRPEALALVIRGIFGELAQSGRIRLSAISSIATGGDTIFAREALAAGMPWLLFMPRPWQDYQRDFPPEQRAEVESMIGRAALTENAVDPQGEPYTYLECGIRTADEADVIIAFWDGLPAAGIGGTADVVDYCRKLGKPLILIDAHTLAVTRKNLGRVRSHVDKSAAAAGLSLEEQFEICDRQATREGPLARQLTGFVILLHLLAVSLAIGVIVFVAKEHRTITLGVGIIKMLILGLVLWLAFHLRRRHHRWLESRSAAEMLRSVLAYRTLPGALGVLRRLAIPDGDELRRSIQMQLAVEKREANAKVPTLEEFRERYLVERISDQKKYYASCLRRALPFLRWLQSGFWTASVAAFFFSLIYIFHLRIYPNLNESVVRETLKTLSLILPLAGAACLSLIATHDLSRRVARYRQMVDLLDRAAVKIHAARSWHGMEDAVAETEEQLLFEIKEWHSLTRFASEAQ